MSAKSLGPWEPARYDVADVAAIQAMVNGEASADQQKRAIKWIVESACGTYDQSFWPGGEEGRRSSDFAEGKRFVGNSIIKMTKLNTAAIKERS